MNLKHMQSTLTQLKLQLDDINHLTLQVVNKIYELENAIDDAVDQEIQKSAPVRMSRQYNIRELIDLGVLVHPQENIKNAPELLEWRY